MKDGYGMGGDFRYMTEEELEALIAEVEDHGMLAPPVYLKELIMEEAARVTGKGEAADSGKSIVKGIREGAVMDISESAAGSRKESAPKEAGISWGSRKGVDRKTAKRILMVYRAKVIGAAAAAIFCLMVVPLEMDGGRAKDSDRWREKVIEEDMERYQEESDRVRKEPEMEKGGMGSFMETIFGKRRAGEMASLWEGMTGWFRMEERNYE